MDQHYNVTEQENICKEDGPITVVSTAAAFINSNFSNEYLEIICLDSEIEQRKHAIDKEKRYH